MFSDIEEMEEQLTVIYQRGVFCKIMRLSSRAAPRQLTGLGHFEKDRLIIVRSEPFCRLFEARQMDIMSRNLRYHVVPASKTMSSGSSKAFRKYPGELVYLTYRSCNDSEDKARIY